MKIRIVDNLNESGPSGRINLKRDVRNSLLKRFKQILSETSDDEELTNRYKNSGLVTCILYNNGKSNNGGYILHHIDFNENNYNYSNLVVITKEAHNYIHHRLVNDCILYHLEKAGHNTKNMRSKLADEDINEEIINNIVNDFSNKQFDYLRKIEHYII